MSNFVYYKVNRNSVAIVDNVPSTTLNTDKYIAKDNNGNVYFYNKNSNSFEVSSVFTILQLLLPFVSNLLLPLIQNILGVVNQMKLPRLEERQTPNLTPNQNPSPPFHLQFNNNSTISPPTSPTTPTTQTPPNTPTNVAVNTMFSSQKHIDHNKSYRVDHNINQMTKCESFCNSCPPTPMHRNYNPSLPLFPPQPPATPQPPLQPSRPQSPPPPQRPSTPPPQRPQSPLPYRPSTPPPQRPTSFSQFMPSYEQQVPQQSFQQNGYSFNNDYFKLMAPFPNYSTSYNGYTPPSVYSGYNQSVNRVSCNVYPM